MTKRLRTFDDMKPNDSMNDGVVDTDLLESAIIYTASDHSETEESNPGALPVNMMFSYGGLDDEVVVTKADDSGIGKNEYPSSVMRPAMAQFVGPTGQDALDAAVLPFWADNSDEKDDTSEVSRKKPRTVSAGEDAATTEPMSSICGTLQDDGDCKRPAKKKSALPSDAVDVDVFNGVTYENSGISRPPESDESLEENHVCLGRIKHPRTKLWRETIKKYSTDRLNYHTWSDEIAGKVQEDLGYPVFYVRVFVPQETTAGKKKNILHGWRVATAQEILDRTKQRFQDDRKSSLDSDIGKRHIGRPRRDEPALAIVNRKAHYPITRSSVCVGWARHPGTVTWCEILTTISENVNDFPEWSDEVSAFIMTQLTQKGCKPFLVCRDSNGMPSTPADCGSWFKATEEEILEANRSRFAENRGSANETNNEQH